MSDNATIIKHTSAQLAEAFFQQHRTEFGAAALEVAVSKQGFYIEPAAFDGFLVTWGVLDAMPEEFNTNSISRRGAVMRRNEVRASINAAALRAETHPAFHIGAARAVRLEDGAAAMRLRVKLINHYAIDKPAEIARSLGVAAKHCQRMMRRVARLAASNTAISAIVRDHLALAAIADPMLEAVEKMALRLERELHRSEIAKRG
jgi:hypothetical protein